MMFNQSSSYKSNSIYTGLYYFIENISEVAICNAMHTAVYIIL